MARIHIRRRHGLDAAQAQALVDELREGLARDLKAETRWQGDTLHFERSGASGRITVGPGVVELDLRLGLLLAPWKGSIEQAIHRRLDAALGPDAGATAV